MQDNLVPVEQIVLRAVVPYVNNQVQGVGFRKSSQRYCKLILLQNICLVYLILLYKYKILCIIIIFIYLPLILGHCSLVAYGG